MLIRKLKYYRWVFKDRHTIIVDKRGKKNIPLKKVHYKSLGKFMFDCLDRARIEDGELAKERARKYREEIRKLKIVIRQLKRELREVKKKKNG